MYNSVVLWSIYIQMRISLSFPLQRCYAKKRCIKTFFWLLMQRNSVLIIDTTKLHFNCWCNKISFWHCWLRMITSISGFHITFDTFLWIYPRVLWYFATLFAVSFSFSSWHLLYHFPENPPTTLLSQHCRFFSQIITNIQIQLTPLCSPFPRNR